MKKIICILILVISTMFLSGCNNIFHQDNKTVAKLQIIEEDINTNKKKVYEEFIINNGDLITLHDKEFYECNRDSNDIKIISIEDDYVVISREKTKYDANNVNKTYTEKVKEKINYNERFNTSINEATPHGIACAQAKYNYYLLFVKE